MFSGVGSKRSEIRLCLIAVVEHNISPTAFRDHRQLNWVTRPSTFGGHLVLSLILRMLPYNFLHHCNLHVMGAGTRTRRL
jgi:hypothetical protein